MKLVAIARIKIDGDILEEFVRHTLQYVDRLFVVDNASPDSSRETLRALQAEGLPLVVLEDDYLEVRADLATRYARYALEHSDAEFALLLDADEFLRVASREALEISFAALPPDTHALVPWVTYVPGAPVQADAPADSPQAWSVLGSMRYRLKHEQRPYSKIFVTRSFLDDPLALVSPGNHYGERTDGSLLPAQELLGVSLAHFPVRSIAQIQAKALLGWGACIAAGLADETVLAYQWKRLYETLRARPQWTDDEFYRYAAHYLGDPEEALPELVFDPLPPVERRYAAKPPAVLDVAMAFIDQLARKHAQLNAKAPLT